eukprot:13741039-Heterocapsa_arctica.AAC.1
MTGCKWRIGHLIGWFLAGLFAGSFKIQWDEWKGTGMQDVNEEPKGSSPNFEWLGSQYFPRTSRRAQGQAEQ